MMSTTLDEKKKNLMTFGAHERGDESIIDETDDVDSRVDSDH